MIGMIEGGVKDCFALVRHPQSLARKELFECRTRLIPMVGLYLF